MLLPGWKPIHYIYDLLGEVFHHYTSHYLWGRHYFYIYEESVKASPFVAFICVFVMIIFFEKIFNVFILVFLYFSCANVSLHSVVIPVGWILRLSSIVSGSISAQHHVLCLCFQPALVVFTVLDRLYFS